MLAITKSEQPTADIELVHRNVQIYHL